MAIIHQEVVLPASPAKVYELLTTSALFTKATGGAPATIDASEGGTFSLFGGAIHGRNIELVPGSRVVQAWRVKVWGAGVYSLVSFALAPDGNGTRVTLEHSSFPAEQEQHLAAGWGTNYWDPLTAFLA
jgi:uncharacterized protein YndB with AHSA1/START domain